MADVRSPAVAGMFYPAETESLQSQIDEYMAAADPPELTAVRAVIVPHAGYIYSGPVAAYAYKLLSHQSKQPDRILLLGPSHRSWFPGVAIADVDAFETPLGTYPVDHDYGEQLSSKRRIFSQVTSPHVPEHSLEVQYPFIQSVYDDVPTVPMLFGEVDPRQVGEALDESMGDNDLIIVSSDLSHYHTNEEAHTIDRRFLEALLEGNIKGLKQGEACGVAPIIALMTVAQTRGWKPHLLDYRTSGDISGNTRQVVGYAAVAYTEGE